MLNDEDDVLFRLAIQEYNTTEPELLRTIVNSWLFNIRLQIEKNHNEKRTRKKRT